MAEQNNIAKMQEELLATQLETARIQQERAQEENEQYRAQKAAKKRANAQRQEQLRIDVTTRRFQASRCKHKQGGTPRNPFNGNGKTSLNRQLMPDGFTKRLSCSICRLVLFSPFEPNKSKKQRDGETQAQMMRRVRKYETDKERFDQLWEAAEDTLTPEAAQIMHCGTTFTVTDADGMPIMKPRPCDSYAMQL